MVIQRSSLALHLKELRTERNLSQYQLADALGISRGNIGNYEIGSREPDYNTLNAFARFYNVSIDYLLGFTEIRERMESRSRVAHYDSLLTTLSSLSKEEVVSLQKNLEYKELYQEIEALSKESVEDLKKYLSLLLLRDSLA